eukprot:350688-Chlamydomonas_euryale.AAC.7
MVAARQKHDVEPAAAVLHMRQRVAAAVTAAAGTAAAGPRSALPALCRKAMPGRGATPSWEPVPCVRDACVGADHAP